MSGAITQSIETEILEIVEFTFGKKKFGVPIQHVQEIIHTRPKTPIPLSHSFIGGMVAVKGEAIPVVQLGKITEETSFAERKQEKMIHLKVNGKPFVLHVDSVSEIRTVDTNSLTKSSESYMMYELEQESDSLYILDLERVLDEIE